MAKVMLDPMFVSISGTLGDLVFKRSSSGQTYVSQRARKSDVPPSPAQIAQREKFKLAAAYAKAALADPRVRKIYEKRAARQGKGAFDLARRDFFKGKNLLPEK